MDNYCRIFLSFVFFSSRRRHTRLQGDWSSDVCSSDLLGILLLFAVVLRSVRGVLLTLLPIAIGLAGATLVAGLVFDRLHAITFAFGASLIRSEERRVGKELRDRQTYVC